jgi:hypothetical protein
MVVRALAKPHKKAFDMKVKNAPTTPRGFRRRRHRVHATAFGSKDAKPRKTEQNCNSTNVLLTF